MLPSKICCSHQILQIYELEEKASNKKCKRLLIYYHWYPKCNPPVHTGNLTSTMVQEQQWFLVLTNNSQFGAHSKSISQMRLGLKHSAYSYQSHKRVKLKPTKPEKTGPKNLLVWFFPIIVPVCFVIFQKKKTLNWYGFSFIEAKTDRKNLTVRFMHKIYNVYIYR